MLFMFIYFQALPKVPIPDLDQTMTEYVRIMEPVLTQQQHDRLKNLTRQFEAPGGLGPILQAYLFDKRDLEPNWVSLLIVLKVIYCFEW